VAPARGAAKLAIPAIRRKRAPKSTGKTPAVSLGLDGEIQESVDAWISPQSEPKPTRSQAIRRLLRSALRSFAGGSGEARERSTNATAPLTMAELEEIVNETPPKEKTARWIRIADEFELVDDGPASDPLGAITVFEGHIIFDPPASVGHDWTARQRPTAKEIYGWIRTLSARRS
jgi:hypothetical protein